MYLISQIYTIVSHTIIVSVMLVLVVLINAQYRNEKESIMLPWRTVSD